MHKFFKRLEFLRKTLEKFGLTWEIVKTSEHKAWARYEVIFRFYDKILKIGSVNIPFEDLMKCSSNELDMTYCFTLSLLATCYNSYAIDDREQLKCIYEKLNPYIKFNCPSYDLRSVDKIDFDYMVENLILDGVDLSGFPDIEEVL